jgi:hypothetical protein
MNQQIYADISTIYADISTIYADISPIYVGDMVFSGCSFLVNKTFMLG